MNSGDKESFIAQFGAVYEHSPWVAEWVFDQYPGASTLAADLLAAYFAAVFI